MSQSSNHRLHRESHRQSPEEACFDARHRWECATASTYLFIRRGRRIFSSSRTNSLGSLFFIMRPAAAGPRPDLLGTEKEKGKETANLHTQIPLVRFCDLAGPNRFPERTSPKRGLARSPCSWGPSPFIGLTYLRSEGEGPGVHKRPMHRANHIVGLA